MAPRPPGKRRRSEEASAGLERRSPVSGLRRASLADRPGPRARLPDLRADRRDARGGRGHQGAGAATCTRYLIEHGVDVIARGRPDRLQGGQGGGPARPGEEARARPDGRAQPRLAAALPALDRAGRAADRGPGDRAGEADRAGRHGRQAPHGGGEPAPGRLDREGVPGPRPRLPRPDPGGVAGADPGGREVRLPPRLQVLDLRDLVDPPGGDQGDRRQGADDPHPGPHGREAEPGRPTSSASWCSASAASPSRRRSPRS